ncbi:Not1-domain-containing protein [Aaosphaeria arxii CBS 175.79]|uniref:General negative regulator of transcription subunit 1 n=1 Tax=Aaosphaeria arxii CBS 175.79 TaxID=1450172 RepID=A0A6A5XT99_9PLEO|nr:Not1-domain-containing protein [Aaosphaeria arxii CBS 175.79]KAF2016173.1 Not1-domain-containing protein [Aaosphaeria arxii CBS 175.79]
MSKQHPWGSSRQHQNPRLDPISTAFAQEQRNTPSPSASRQGFSPITSNFPSLPSATARNISSRKSSAASSTSSPFSPLNAGQQPPASQLLSSRARIIAPQSSSHLASSAAALPTASQGGGGTSSSGGGASKLARASPSLSTSSTVGSPNASTNPAGSAPTQNLSRIVIAQVFLLLSQFGAVKDDKDKAKWDTQTEQIRKLVDSNGMEVFSKYFRRLLQNNAAQVFPTGGRTVDPNGSYQILVSEMQKLRKDPEQAARIAESIDSNEGDLFRDFDLSTFVSHFQLDPIEKTALALECRVANKSDLKTKADAILANTVDAFLLAYARPSPVQTDLPLKLEVTILERLLENPPRDWDDDKKMQIPYAAHMRYQQSLQIPVPAEVDSVLRLLELTDGSHTLVKFVQRAGPRATATVEASKEMLSTVETRDISYQQVANVLLYMAITQENQGYSLKNFVAALREHRTGQRLDWQDVVHAFDRDGIRIAKQQFLAIYNALLPIANEVESFDIQLLWGGVWQYEMTQLAFLWCFLSCTPDELDVSQIPRLRASFSRQTFEGASDEIKELGARAAKHPYVSLEATTALFGMIFRSSESYHQAQLLGIPDAIINPHTAEFLIAAVAVPKPWGALQEQALKQLFEPYFTKKLAAYDFVLYGLWQQDPQWLVDRFVDSYNADLMSLSLIMEHAQAHGWLETLIRSNTDISLDLAAQAHARGLFEIEPWLQQTIEQAGPLFRRILSNFLSARAAEEQQTQRDDHHPISLPLAVKTVHPLLWFLAECGLPEQELLPLQRNCIQSYPRLINYGEGVDDIIDANSKSGNKLPDDADKKMQEHFKNMYSGESDVRDIINVLKKYKESQDPAEQDLFACMIHGLFDEYNCFGEYPLEALATTAVLFGGIINYNLLSRIALQVGLAMVLEAVQDYRPEDSMYKFGLQALLHFSSRLPEWPNYCDQLLIVPGLQGTEIYAKAEEVVGRQVNDLNGDSQNGVGLTNGNGVDEILQTETGVPKFSCLHVDPPLRPELYEEPDEEVQDKVLFVLNNVSERNLRDKIKDLMEAVEEKHHQWFAGYLVEERAKMQPNFQQLYLDMLELFNDKTLWAEVLRETYVTVNRMLNSDGQLGSTERTHLKNLGAWLGSLTIARNQPIKFRNISFKDLLIEGYDTDRLLIVIPFTCKVLVQAAKSSVFKPPNPWLMEIVRVLMELYNCADLKLNQKFEIEVLCKGLDLDHKTIEASNVIGSRQHAEEEYLGPLAPEGLEPFSDLSIMSLNRARGPSERFSSAAITAALPNFSNQLIYPPAGSNAVPATDLKAIFARAVSQAIQEIIAPVVERSVTIAAISTSQLINKDFAMEPDEEKLRNAAHTVVKSLSGALALVTCKEPLRMSIMNNIRVMARDLPEQALPEGHVLMFVNDNLDLVCRHVEQAAEQASMNEIDMQIEESVRIRRMFRNTRPNEPFKDANISPWAFYIPEPYKQSPGGLNADQLAIYEDFGRQSRGVPHANNTSQDGGRQVPDVLSDQFPPVPSLPTPAAAPAEPRQTTQQQPRHQGVQGVPTPGPQQQLNGYLESGPNRDQRTAEELWVELTRVVKEAPEERLSELRPISPIHGVFDRLISSIEHAGLEKDNFAFRIAGQLVNYLFSEQLRRLEIEIMTRLLADLCQLSVQTSRQVLMWLATMHDDDRIFNATVMVCLIDVGLMDMHRLNTVIAKAISQRRVAAIEMLSNLLDDVLLNEHPIALRADFALSVDALTNWLAEDPNLELGKQLISKLHVPSNEQALTPPATGKTDQLEYVFDEWVHLQLPDTPKTSIGAFIYQLHQSKVMQTPTDSIEFIRICIDASVAAYEHEEFAPYGTGNLDTATIKVDALGKLIVSLVAYQGESDGAVQESKAKYIDSILLVVVLVLGNHHKTRGDRFNQKVFFRLFSSILFELNEAVKDDALIESKGEIYLAVARAFLILQPQHYPMFTFSWLTLISHRIFMPAMLESNMQMANTKDKRWDLYACLVETLLKYTGQLIKPTGETIMGQNFYRGVLRVLLVIHHDYPEFLAEHHFRFCNSIPMHCTQLRNLIVSAYPSHIIDMPDPFTAGLKVDRVDEIRQSPTIRADIDKLLVDAGIMDTIDALLKTSTPKAEDIEKVCNATQFAENRAAGFELVPTSSDPILIHAIVIYIGTAALEAQGSKAPNFETTAPAAKLLESLAKEFNPEARFHFISAIANQLRWPNAHTHYFSYALLHLFGPPDSDATILEVQQTITRVLLERLLVHRPHPWGLIITLLEILKNRTYAFWDLPFVKAAPEVERLFNALFTHAQQSPQPLV